MSSSTLYRVYRTKATQYAEMRNGWGTAPVIWSYLCVKYLHRQPHEYLLPNDTALWDLARSEVVPRELRLVHAFCCDQAMCPMDRLAELAEACEYAWRLTSTDSARVNHWATVANFLRGIARKPKQIGVALNCTSVCDIWSSYGTPRAESQRAAWDIFPYVDQRRAA